MVTEVRYCYSVSKSSLRLTHLAQSPRLMHMQEARARCCILFSSSQMAPHKLEDGRVCPRFIRNENMIRRLTTSLRAMKHVWLALDAPVYTGWSSKQNLTWVELLETFGLVSRSCHKSGRSGSRTFPRSHRTQQDEGGCRSIGRTRGWGLIPTAPIKIVAPS